MLLYLVKLQDRSKSLAKIAYGWCAVIWENRQSCGDWETLLFLPLEVAFRRCDPAKYWYYADLTHSGHHRELADTIFKSNKSEAIADLLCALTIFRDREPAIKSLGICIRYIVDLHRNITVPLSPRLRRLVIRSVALIGHEGFEEVGMDRFAELLNHLQVSVEEVDVQIEWGTLLLETAQSPEGHLHLPVQSWELLVKLAAQDLLGLGDITYSPQVTASLLRAQEWDKLECWMGLVWMLWTPNDIPDDLGNAMESLFRKRPDAIQKLTQWVEQWSKKSERDAPESFELICEQAREATL